MIIPGTVIELEVPNEKGRVYKREDFEAIVDQFQRGDIEILGEPMQKEESFVNLEDVSHRVTDLFISDNALEAEVTLLDTPKGKIIKRILEERNLNIEFRIRGTGVLNDLGDGIYEVTDYNLIAIDLEIWGW